MGNELTCADLALVQAAIDEANAAMGRALAVIENTAAQLEREITPCAGCGGVDDGCGTWPPTRHDGSCGCPRAGDTPAACGGCQGEDFGDCAGCAQAPAGARWIDGEPAGRVIGAGGRRAQD